MTPADGVLYGGPVMGLRWLVALLGSAPAATTALVPEPALTIQVDADPACDRADALQRELGRYRLATGDHDARIDARIDVQIRSADAGGFAIALRIEFADGSVDRRFDAASCELATSATALMIAVALDPTGALEALDHAEAELAPESEPEPESEPPSEPEPVPESEPEPEPEPEPKPRDLGLVAQLAGQGGLGPLPGFGFELFASLGLRARATRVELLTHAGLPRTIRLPDRDAGVRLHYWSLGLRGCGEPTVARVGLGFPLCLGPELGGLTAVGFGLDQNRRSSARWLAVAGSAGLSWSPTRVFGVFLAAEAWLGIARPRTRIEGAGVVHRPEQAGMRVRAGVEFRWPNNLGRRRPN
jgi:hypothetical protein